MHKKLDVFDKAACDTLVYCASEPSISFSINIANQYIFCDSIPVINDKAFVEPVLKQLQGLYLIKVLK